jgi:hypothetical protein
MNKLDLRVKRPLREHQETDWPTWKNEAGVLERMCSASGLQDKSIAIEIDVDPAILSKAKSGQARLSEQHMDALMDATGSEAWLQYWLLKRGYDPRFLHRIETDVQRENRELREEVARLKQEREIEMRLVRDMRVAA